MLFKIWHQVLNTSTTRNWPDKRMPLLFNYMRVWSLRCQPSFALTDSDDGRWIDLRQEGWFHGPLGRRTASMAKKILKWRDQTRVAPQPRKSQPNCPHCGTIRNEKSATFLVDQLFQSHAELCTMLRSAGRQILRFENEDGGSLEKIRRVLKRADHIRQTLRGPDELPGRTIMPSTDDLIVEAASSVSDYTSESVTEPSPAEATSLSTRFLSPTEADH